MAQLHLSDEILMAFADGELEGALAATVEQAMVSNPAIAGRVAGFLRSRRLVRSAFPEETEADVSPALRAAIQAQIDRFESSSRQEILSGTRTKFHVPLAGQRSLRMALAASVAGLAIAAAGYFIGRQNPLPSEAAGPIAHLADPQVGHILSESRSGQEQDLSFGRLRVISTFRTSNGSLCREFRLQTLSGASGAVACRDGGWKIAFAVAEVSGTYVPSGGGDLMENYLQSVGAREPLLDEMESKSLSEAKP